jgi:indole-3-glycerol phosphate synthase
MNTILDTIIAYKKREVAQQKKEVTTAQLEASPYFNKTTISIATNIINAPKAGIIAELKRKSPSKGWIKQDLNVADVAKQYSMGGASALSILTDNEFFGGSNEDVLNARLVTKLPILRKEFIIDEYQILEAKAMGADVILLIAANLTQNECKHLAHFAKSLSLEILLEIHTESELDYIQPNINLVGVNNRNLKDFAVSLDHSAFLADKIPQAFIKVAESGLQSATEINTLMQAGFKGFLMGEYFMKQPNQQMALENLLKEIHE